MTFSLTDSIGKKIYSIIALVMVMVFIILFSVLYLVKTINRISIIGVLERGHTISQFQAVAEFNKYVHSGDMQNFELFKKHIQKTISYAGTFGRVVEDIEKKSISEMAEHFNNTFTECNYQEAKDIVVLVKLFSSNPNILKMIQTAQESEKTAMRFLDLAEKYAASEHKAGRKEILNNINALDKNLLEVPKLFSQAVSRISQWALSLAKKALWISFSLVSIATMLGFMFIITRMIIRPLKDATNLAQIITTGDLTQRINQEQQDEFGILSRAMNQICEKMSENIGQVASASHQLAEGASEQAASIEETSSSLEELSSMTKNNANNADQADNLMKEAGNAVSQANEFMSKLSISMDDISKANNETQKIIKTIDEIAFQTNLLALNAAVEAARAGEVGAGFSVVAEEVRSLALRSAEAAKNTAKMIEGTVAKTHEGLSLTQETGETFAGVVEASSKAEKLIGEISAASKEQAQGIEQINIAVVEMDKVTQQNAAGAEELASSTAMFKTSKDIAEEITRGSG